MGFFKRVFCFRKILHLLAYFSGFYKFLEDMKARFELKEKGEHLTDLSF